MFMSIFFFFFFFFFFFSKRARVLASTQIYLKSLTSICLSIGAGKKSILEGL